MKKHYNKLLAVLITFIAAPLIGQGLIFELGYNDSYKQSPQALLCVDDYSYLAYEQQLLGDNSKAYIVKNDLAGNELWSLTLPVGASQFIMVSEIFPTDDGGIYVCGSGLYTCIIGEPYAFVMKFTSGGELEWSRFSSNNYSDEGEFILWGVEGFSLVYDEVAFTISGDYYTIDGSESFIALMKYDNQGGLADSLIIEQESLQNFVTIADHDYLAFDEDMLYSYDDVIGLQQSIQMSDIAVDMKVVDGELYVLQTSELVIYDSNLELINSYDYPDYDNFYKLKVIDNQVNFISTDGVGSSTIIELNSNFEIETTTTIPVVVDFGNPSDYDTSHFAHAEKFFLADGLAIRYRDFSLTDEEDSFVNLTDIALVDIVGNDITVGNQGANNMHYVEVDVSVLVKNNGENTLTSARLNKYISWGICNPYYFTEEYDGLDLAPGDSMWVNIGFVGETPVQILPGSEVVNVNICLYSSHANSLTDLNVENDEVCKELEFDYVGVEELDRETLSVYPNPTEGILHFQDAEGKYVIYEIYGSDGSLKLNGQLQNGGIDLKGLAAGMYFLRAQDEKGKVYYSKTIVKN